ncbi:MAG: nucleotidyltransferase domain-containing protein [Anaerolineae bacterium]|nr:nucleotidyltransferase domain-containing protein [Anaerolineae bacterium]MDQ7036721.1 nucleotidyltransferase domain-containing protein [Anaerolineae bacterium]
MSIQENISIPFDAINDFCKRNHIRKLSLFGSVLGSDFTHGSDIGVLVEFEPNVIIGWKIVAMRQELIDILGHEVDFLTPKSLSLTFRDEVLAQAQVIYEQAR